MTEEELAAAQDELKHQQDEEAANDVMEVAIQTKALQVHWWSVFEHFRENMSMCYGDQISEIEKARLDADGAPKVARNVILPKVLQFQGSCLKRQRSITAFPVDNGSDQIVADLISKLFKHTEQDNALNYTAMLVRYSGLITRMGWYYMPPPPENAEGEDVLVKIYHEDTECILLDADAKDLKQRTWKRVIRTSWLTKDELKDRWPDKAEEIEKNLGNIDRVFGELNDRLKVGLKTSSTTVTQTGSSITSNVPEDLGASVSAGSGITRDDLYDVVNHMYRVEEAWERRSERVPNEDGLGTHKKEYMLLRVTLPYLMMRLGRYELPYKWYPFFLYMPLDMGGSIIDRASYVDQVRPLQEEKNRKHALAEDAASRAVWESLIFPPGEELLVQDIKNNGGKPYIGTRANTNGQIDHINSSGINAGIQAEIQGLNEDIETVGVIPPAVGGAAENASESGSYFGQKVDQGEQSIEPFQFVENETTLPTLYRAMIERYQLYYTAQMILRIEGEEPGSVEDVSINELDWATGQIKNDVTQGRYDITLDDVEESRSMRDPVAKEIGGLIQSLPPNTPPPVYGLLLSSYIANSRLPKRRELAQQIAAFYNPQPVAPPGAPPQMQGISGAVPPEQQAPPVPQMPQQPVPYPQVRAFQ